MQPAPYHRPYQKERNKFRSFVVENQTENDVVNGHINDRLDNPPEVADIQTARLSHEVGIGLVQHYLSITRFRISQDLGEVFYHFESTGLEELGFLPLQFVSASHCLLEPLMSASSADLNYASTERIIDMGLSNC